MKRYIRNLLQNNLFKNILVLLQGNLIVSMISVINMALLVKTIGLEANGVIFMGQAYANLFNDLFNFQSFESIIKYVPIYLHKNNVKVINYIKQGFILDILTAIIAFLASISLIIPTSSLMGWENELIFISILYSIMILFKITGTSIGILRIFNKFKYTVYINISEVLIRFIWYSFGSINKMGIFYYVFGDLVISIISIIIMFILTYITLYENKMQNLFSIKTRIDKEFLKFNIFTNIQLTLDMPIRNITPFIINKFLGLSDIAVYKIIEKIGSIVSKITTPISTALSPEISQKIASGNLNQAIKIHKKIIKLVSLFGSIVIIALFLSKGLWMELFIPPTNKNILALFIYLIYLIYTNSFMAQHSIFIYAGFIKYSIGIVTISNLIYLIALIFLSLKYGIVGVMIARLIQSSIIFILKAIVLKIKNTMYETR